MKTFILGLLVGLMLACTATWALDDYYTDPTAKMLRDAAKQWDPAGAAREQAARDNTSRTDLAPPYDPYKKSPC